MRALFLALLVACGSSEPTVETPPEPVAAPDPATDEAAKLAAIAVEIRANPEGFEATLAKHGMTSAQFEAAIYRIAEDPGSTTRFEAGVGF